MDQDRIEMPDDRQITIPVRPGLSAAVVALGQEYASLDGVTVLAANQRRPDSYYTASHVTGKTNDAPDAYEIRPI